MNIHTKHAHRWLTLIVAVLALILTGCDNAAVNNTAAQQPAEVTQAATEAPAAYTVLALGDSLTEGLGVAADGNYPAILEQSLHEAGFAGVKVVNSGLSGETSSGLKARVDWVLQLKPQLTILTIGANDAMRGLPLELTRNNISEIIQTIQASGSKVILGGMEIYDNLGREYVDGFKELYPALAAQHKVSLIPFFLEHVAGNPTLNQADLIHPTSAGYDIIVQRNVLPAVLPVLEQQLKQ
jgi:acyl-CoA thioesterase-1